MIFPSLYYRILSHSHQPTVNLFSNPQIMRLLQAHEYLSRRLDLDRPGKLRTVVPQRPLEALNVLREKEIVAPHATRGLHVIAPHRFIGLTLTDANSTVAFCKKGVPTTVAEYYRSRNERLLWPHLPLLVVGAPAMVIS